MLLLRMLVWALVVLLGGCATYVATSGHVVLEDRDTRVAVGINEHDRALIEEYYARSRKSLPPGLAKRRGGLPPGLAKREKLPPGLNREPLPIELERRLTPLPSGYARVRVGADVVLLDERTRLVVDVIYDIAI